MTPERWRQVKELFESALERAPAERLAFLDQACDGDEPLRSEVESLLVSFNEGESFMERPAVALAAEALAGSQGESLIGQRIGHYQVTREIGRGGMGEVYLAQDTRLGRHVALKLLPTLFTRDEDRLRRFEREARAASALNHPNVCVIYEVGETADDRHYIAMEYVDGETLRQPMTSRRMRLDEVLEVAVQVASGLAAAHEVGIVHRDIKPENIMRRRDGYVKVLDFGLAKLFQRKGEGEKGKRGDDEPTLALSPHLPLSPSPLLTNPGIVMGTSGYMSPEQARGLSVDARTDIWSLGVVLYEMVAGEAPFKGETTSDVIVSILDREPQPLAHYRPAVPAELQEIVSKTLSKSREQRYQTIEELAGKLKSLKQELEYATRNETAGERATRTGKQAKRLTSSAKYLISGIKRYQQVAALTVAMLIIALAASAYFRFARSQQTIDSLAALPFVNVGADPNTEYLSDGITESLINSLSHLPDLKVISF